MKRRSVFFQTPFPLFFGILFFIGILAGAVYAQAFGDTGYLHYFVTGYLAEHLNGEFSPVFSLSFLPVIGVNLLLCILALSCIAVPIILTLPFIKGFSIGMIGASLYLTYGLKGILIDALLLWLPSVLQSIALLVFCCEATVASLELFRVALLHRGFLNISAGDILSGFVLWSSVGLSAAILEGVLSMMFGALF